MWHRVLVMASVAVCLGAGSLVPARPAAAVELAFHRTAYPIRDLPPDRLPYVAASPGPLTDPLVTYDAAGVAMAIFNGKAYDHPVVQAQYMLNRLSSFAINRDPRYLRRVVVHARRLMDRSLAARDARYLPYPFDFPLHGRTDDLMRAPWYSAMAQGQALSAFVRLYRVTRQARYLEFARELFTSLRSKRTTGTPWVVDIDSDGYLWFEEYAKHPGADRTFNGHVFAIFGLYDYWQLTRDSKALELLRGGLTAAAHRAREIRVIGGISKYCLTHQVPSAKYHSVHVGQLYLLYSITGDREFARLADAFLADFPAAQGGGSGHLGAGTYQALSLDPLGRVTGTRTLLVGQAEAVTFGHRRKPRGHKEIWLRIDSGSAAGYWVAERPDQAYVAGLIEGYAFLPHRGVLLSRGTVVGYQFGKDGHVTGTLRVRLRADARFAADRRAVANGRPHLHLVDGPLADHWVPVGPGASLDD